MLDVYKTEAKFNEGIDGPSDILVSPQQFKKLVQQANQADAAAKAEAQTVPGAARRQGANSETSLAPGSALSSPSGRSAMRNARSQR